MKLPNRRVMAVALTLSAIACPGISSAQPGQTTTPPRLAKYLIMSHGNPAMAPLHLGTFELLSGGRYVSRDMGGKSLGSGEYTYDAKSMQVSWTSGPFLDNKWGGKFEIRRDGKSHQIRFTRSTTGTNSSDSK